MKIEIEAIAKKLLFSASISGTIQIDLPINCIMDGIVRDKIILALNEISTGGVRLKGKITIDGNTTTF